MRIVTTLHSDSSTVTMTFPCVQCRKNFQVKAEWVYHLEHEHGLIPVPLDSAETHLSGLIEVGTGMSTSSISPAEIASPALQHCVEPGVSFRVAFDLGQRVEVQPIRTTGPSMALLIHRCLVKLHLLPYSRKAHQHLMVLSLLSQWSTPHQ